MDMYFIFTNYYEMTDMNNAAKTQFTATVSEANLSVTRMSGFMLKTMQRYRSTVIATEIMEVVHCPSTQRNPTLGQKLSKMFSKSWYR